MTTNTFIAHKLHILEERLHYARSVFQDVRNSRAYFFMDQTAPELVSDSLQFNPRLFMHTHLR